MKKSGLGRGLDSMTNLAEDGPDLSRFITISDGKQTLDSPGIAILWMIFGSICFGTMNALVKWTSVDADVWMIIFIRSLVITVIVALYAKTYSINLKPNDSKTMFLRCLVGLIAMILYFTALSRIPIGQAVTLQYTAPLFVALLSGTIIREKASKSVLILSITSFIFEALELW